MIREKMYEKVQLFKRLGYSRAKISSDLEIDPRTAAKIDYLGRAKGAGNLFSFDVLIKKSSRF